MSRTHAVILTALFGALALHARAATPDDDFDRDRVQSGQSLYRDKRYTEAIEQFRVAAFGYLSQPAQLEAALIQLSLAQAAANKATETDATIERFLEIERRFSVYPTVELPADLRASFKTLLLARVGQATILAVPTLAGMVETEEQKIAALPPAERRKAWEAASRREPGNVIWPVALARDALDRGDAKEAERWAGKALAIQPTSADALAVRAAARTARGECTDALRDLAALSAEELGKHPELYADLFVCDVDARNWDGAAAAAPRVPQSAANRPDVVRARSRFDAAQPQASREAAPTRVARGTTAAPAASPTPLDTAAKSARALEESRRLIGTGKAVEAERLLTDAVRSDPGNRDLRLELLEAACLSRSYQIAAAQVGAVKPLADSEGPSLFYASVALYETGHVDEARAYFERARPKVTGVLVDEYARKILGTH